MVGIRLADGRVLRAQDFTAVETAWSDYFMNAAIEPDQFRKEVEQRAKLWSGVEIAIDGNARDFLLECERAGLLSVLTDASSTTDVELDPEKIVPRVVYLASVREMRERREARRQERESAKG